jgi:hypothetical protein
MSTEIFSYKGYQLRKIINIVLIGLNAILFVAMVKGPVGNFSIFLKYDFPVWAYIVTVLFMIVSLIIYMSNVQNKAPIIGTIEFLQTELVITQKNRKHRVRTDEIYEISISLDYSRDKIYSNKIQYLFKLTSSNMSINLDLFLDKNSEKLANEFVHRVNGGKQLITKNQKIKNTTGNNGEHP